MSSIKLFSLLSIFALLFIKNNIYGQGCSDAGFCTMGAMKPGQHLSKKYNVKLKSIEFTQYIGHTKFGDEILTYLADINIGLNNKTAVQLKLPYTFVFGSLAHTRGAGDISYSITRNIISKDKFQINYTLGGKAPTNQSDKKVEGRHLPMYYQTSLGTWDLVTGLSLMTSKWLFATGFQHAFNQNKNEFKWGPWNKTEDSVLASVYPVSPFLKRGSDVMFRIERSFPIYRWTFSTGMLYIYRLNKDVITSPKTGERIQAEHSNGLAFTYTASANFKINTHSAIKFLFGARIIEREINPDGLSRKLVGNISYQYSF